VLETEREWFWQRVSAFDVAILVGGGVGVTPIMASASLRILRLSLITLPFLHSRCLAR